MTEHAKTVQYLRAETSDLSKQIAQVHTDRNRLKKDLKSAANYITKIEQQTLESNQRSLDLLKNVRDLEVEAAQLRNYIVDLKARVAIYVPVKEDPVDVKVAEFINSYPDRTKLKIIFMRESSGVYEFGTKRVYARVEKNKIQIRVGGGYISIDEFLEQYTPIEVEKLEKRDPLKRYSEKVVIQKTLMGHDVQKE